MISLGIMQGRLTPSKDKGIQFFPFEEWEREFEIGSKIGLNEIEWIFDYDRFEENPIWAESGVREIKKIISSTGIRVRSVCFDYFMRRPFYKYGGEDAKKVKKENLEFTRNIIFKMKEINASLLEIPMVDNSSVKNSYEEEQIIEFLHIVLDFAKQADILIGCEMDFPVGEFRSFLQKVNHNRIRANYDSGNSSGLGYDHRDEILSLSQYIANVHIKDRVFHGTTVQLGTGNADFEKVFSALKDIGYDKSILLQAARGEDGNEEDTVKKQIAFVQGYCRKYGLR